MRFSRLQLTAWKRIGVLVLVFSSASPLDVFGQNGVWNNPAGGDYNTAGNWQAGVIAGGAGATADFSTLMVSS